MVPIEVEEFAKNKDMKPQSFHKSGRVINVTKLFIVRMNWQ